MNFAANIDVKYFICKLFRLFLNNKLSFIRKVILWIICYNGYLNNDYFCVSYISKYKNDMFKQKVRRYIEEKELVGISDKVLVALSGGADSVALLRVLVELGYKCICAHCNFHLRGDESVRDEKFVTELCHSLSVPLEKVHFDTMGYASSHGVSIEMAARELRYGWFEQVRQKHGASCIAVAHHRDDSVETFLLNLSRGTGINGLKGISPKNGYVVRPLLEVGRADILDYLRHIGQDFVTDSTNLEDVYTRNKIRLDIIPMFRQINPSFVTSVAETASRLSDVAAIYKKAIGESLERVKKDEFTVDINRLGEEVAPQSVVYEWLAPYGFNSSQINDVIGSLDSESGKIFLSKEWELLRDRSSLVLRRKQEESHEYALKFSTMDVDEGFSVPRDNSKAYVDADKVKADLLLRKWKSGDRFVPFGMKGFKKVRDYLRDRKLSVFEKENVMVVTSGEDIVWIVNERTDNRFRIDSDTKRVMVIEVEAL